jgi:hypothetical protein
VEEFGIMAGFLALRMCFMVDDDVDGSSGAV